MADLAEELPVTKRSNAELLRGDHPNAEPCQVIQDIISASLFLIVHSFLRLFRPLLQLCNNSEQAVNYEASMRPLSYLSTCPASFDITSGIRAFTFSDPRPPQSIKDSTNFHGICKPQSCTPGYGSLPQILHRASLMTGR